MKKMIRPLFTAVILISIIFHLAVDDQALAQSSPTNSEQLVSIDFNNVDLVVFIKFMSDLTKKNFIVDDKVKGKVTIISPGKITVEEAYRVFLSVLEVHGYATVPAGKITKIIPSPEARSKSIKTRLQEESGVVGDDVVTQLIPLRYADPNEIKKLFTPLVSKSSVILSYPPTSTLIITDVQSNIRRLMRILKAIDITGVGRQIAIIPVDYADASKLVTLLTSIFKKGAKTKGAVRKELTFVADERTNSIVLLASEGDTDNIRRLIRSLDKETPKGQAKIHVYYLEHADAEELAKVLLDIPQKETAAKTPGKKTAPVVSDKVRISADKATNSLIIMADMEDYVVLESIIKKIDIPRSMVYIEALIMEVNVTKDFRLGTEYILGGETSLHDKDAIYGGGFSAGPNAGTTGTLGALSGVGTGVPLPPGFSLGLFGESIEVGGLTFPSISALVQAYKEDTDVNILSTPQILTTDNQEAKIYVGSNIPFQTQTTNSDSGTALYNSFEYRDVGKTLKITPHISKDRMVRLELSLEVSSVSGTQTTTPTTLKRTVETTAIVKDTNTVVLGGLIDDQMDTTVYKVPCLGDIPLLQYLFRKTSNSHDKTNLYIFLTPRVIQNPDEASQVSKNKRDQIDKLREENIKLYNDWQEKESTEDPKEPKVESLKYNETHSPTSQLAPLPKEEPVEETAVSDRELSATDLKDDRTVQSIPQTDRHDPPLIRNISTGESSRTASYTVQVASVPSVQQADRILKKLIDRGYAAYAVQSDVANQTQYRVRIGFFDTAQSTHHLMDRLKSDQYEPTLVEF